MVDIWVLGGKACVDERKQQRVVVGHPNKAGGRNALAEMDTVGQHRADTCPIEHPGAVVLALAPAHAVAGGFEVRLRHRGERWRSMEAPKGAPCLGARSEIGAPGERIGFRLHIVDGKSIELAIGSHSRRRKQRVGVVVDSRRVRDGSSDGGIDLALQRVVRRACAMGVTLCLGRAGKAKREHEAGGWQACPAAGER